MFFSLPSSDKPHFVDAGGIILTMGVWQPKRGAINIGFLTHRHPLQPVAQGGTYHEPNGGAAAQVAVDWLNWQLRGDAKAATLTVLAMLRAAPMLGIAAQPAEGNFSFPVIAPASTCRPLSAQLRVLPCACTAWSL